MPTSSSRRLFFAALLVCALGRAGASERATMLLDLEDRSVDPFRSTDARAVVFIFTKTDCPISNRYAPELRKIRGAFDERPVAFWLVYPDPDETPQAIRKHLEEYDYPLTALRDPNHALVRRVGATVTPEAAVFDSNGKLRYRGRIDDTYVAFGKRRPAPTVRDLQQAVDAVLEGRAIENPTTTAVGCFIAPLK